MRNLRRFLAVGIAMLLISACGGGGGGTGGGSGLTSGTDGGVSAGTGSTPGINTADSSNPIGGSDSSGTNPEGGNNNNGNVVASGSAILNWDAPSANVDGTPLTDLAGYKVYYGRSAGNYDQEVDIGNSTSHTVENLQSGTTYYFAVTAYDSKGIESTFSNEVNKSL